LYQVPPGEKVVDQAAVVTHEEKGSRRPGDAGKKQKTAVKEFGEEASRLESEKKGRGFCQKNEEAARINFDWDTWRGDLERTPRI